MYVSLCLYLYDEVEMYQWDVQVSIYVCLYLNVDVCDSFILNYVEADVRLCVFLWLSVSVS